jgi:Amino acid permease
MNLADLLLGRPLATEDEKAQRIGPAKGIPIFGLDALSSAAYGPEAALTLLIPLGMAGIAYIWPISLSIDVLLGIVYFSYRQTIEAYPQGGGSYTVASENLGVWAGLLAAASLMVDYVLTAGVGISAGVGALVSAVPSLQPYTLVMCLGILTILTLINLRGVRETGGIFLLPTYLFIVCLLGMIVIGVIKAISTSGHPVPVVAPPKLISATAGVGAWLLLRAFASGRKTRKRRAKANFHLPVILITGSWFLDSNRADAYVRADAPAEDLFHAITQLTGQCAGQQFLKGFEELADRDLGGQQNTRKRSALFLRSAHLRFIPSEMRLLAAPLRRPLRGLLVALPAFRASMARIKFSSSLSSSKMISSPTTENLLNLHGVASIL